MKYPNEAITDSFGRQMLLTLDEALEFEQHNMCKIVDLSSCQVRSEFPHIGFHSDLIPTTKNNPPESRDLPEMSQLPRPLSLDQVRPVMPHSSDGRPPLGYSHTS